MGESSLSAAITQGSQSLREGGRLCCGGVEGTQTKSRCFSAQGCVSVAKRPAQGRHRQSWAVESRSSDVAFLKVSSVREQFLGEARLEEFETLKSRDEENSLKAAGHFCESIDFL